MKHNSYLIFACILLCMSMSFVGQAQKELYSSGLRHFEAKQYNKALEYFYADKYGAGNKDLLIRRVISNYKMGKLDTAKKDVSTLLAFDAVPDEIYLYIGKIFHAEGNYRKAVENYKVYLRKLSSKSDQRKDIIHLVKQCGEALKIKHQKPKAFVDNYGEELNTIYDEFSMIQSPNFENKYYFTSARESSTGGRRNRKGQKDNIYGSFNSDMYAIELVDGKWMEAEKLNPFINTSRDEIALGFSSDGGVLYYMKGPDYSKGTIYLDSFAIKQENTLSESRFESSIRAEIGDVYLQVFTEDIIVFSSNRPGGFGGYDIYMSFKENGKWSKAINLGPKINSRCDEVSPFLTNDGLSVYFSSNRIKSIGGFDVFQSDYDLRNKSWTIPTNLGEPINSSCDDLYFYVAENGFTANLTSDRKPGYGGYDLFAVYFKDQEKHQLIKATNIAFLEEIDFFPEQLANNAKNNRSTTSQRGKEKAMKKKRRRKKKRRSKDDYVQAKPIKPKNDQENLAKESISYTSNETSTSDKIDEYTINPLFYTSDEKILSPANKREVDLIHQLLSTYPSLDLTIKSHTIEDGLEAYDLYFSIKRAEKIAKYLTEKGISQNRISLKGYGSNYPITKIQTGGEPSKIALKLNSRIEFQITMSKQAPVEITVIEPYIIEYLRDPRWEILKKIEKGLSYRVQIASVTKMYHNQALLIYSESMIEKNTDSENYRYTLGLFESHSDAIVLVKDLANYKINGAFIVPYVDGQRIPKERFVEYAKKYPDLLNFIQYNG